MLNELSISACMQVVPRGLANIWEGRLEAHLMAPGSDQDSNSGGQPCTKVLQQAVEQEAENQRETPAKHT